MDKLKGTHQSVDGPILRVQDLSIDSIHYGLPKRLVNTVSFDVPAGKTTAIVGESGSGKTLTAMAIMGLLPNDELRTTPKSHVYFRGEDILQTDPSAVCKLHGRQMTMVFQEPGSSLNPVLSIGNQIVQPLRRHLGLSRSQALTRAKELLHEVGIEFPAKRLNSYPHELSGGQQQRVMIAMAISCGPQVVIADEPTSALDVTVQRQILDLFFRLQQKHALTILFITHDLGIVAEMADEVIVFHRGSIQEQGAKARVLGSPEHAYTQALIASRSRLDGCRNGARYVDNAAVSVNAQASAEKSPPLLEVRNLVKNYAGRSWFRNVVPFPAVRNISFSLSRGEILGIVGESGSGKTTVAMAIARLIKVTEGQVLLDGKECLALPAREFRSLRRRIQLVFQNPYASLNPRWTIGRTLASPLELIGLGRETHECRKRAGDTLRMVGLNEGDLDKFPHQFSGGQRQRIAIARAIVGRPDILICDEAVSALDVSVQVQIMDLLRELQRDLGIACLFISHDLNAIRYIADRLLVMRSGEIVEEGTVASIVESPRHSYTAELLAAEPRMGPM